MSIKQALTFTLLAALAAPAPAHAEGTGKQGIFTIFNNTSEHTVTGFYTNDGEGWSENWLDSELAPGESAKAEFTEDGGPCDQTLQVGWLGDDGSEVLDDPIDIDICDASNVYLDDNEISYD